MTPYRTSEEMRDAAREVALGHIGQPAATPTASGRTCRINYCERRHQRNHFCCRVCWRSLPKHLRDAIWAAFRGPGVFSNQYLQAAENAEAFLEDRDAVDVGKVFE